MDLWAPNEYLRFVATELPSAALWGEIHGFPAVPKSPAIADVAPNLPRHHGGAIPSVFIRIVKPLAEVESEAHVSFYSLAIPAAH
jgi:hypothetical protein